MDRTGVEALLKAAMDLKLALLSTIPGGNASEDNAMIDDLSDALSAAAVAIDVDAAEQINSMLCAHTFYKMGIVEEDPPSLAEFGLLDQVVASRITRLVDDSERAVLPRGAGRTIRTVMDDRGVAAIYATYHYDAIPPATLNDSDVDPVAETPGKGLFVIKMRRS